MVKIVSLSSTATAFFLLEAFDELLEIGSWAWRCTLIVKHSLGSINLVSVPESFFLHELHKHLHQVKRAARKVLWLRT